MPETTEVASEQPPTISVTFVASAQYPFDVQHFTALVGTEPTRVWHQENPLLKGRTDFPQFEWQYKGGRQSSWEMDEVVRPIAMLFWPARNGITAFAREHDVSISISCYVRLSSQGERPVLSLDAKTIALLNDLGAEFDLDIAI
jgi:hypothetical protein